MMSSFGLVAIAVAMWAVSSWTVGRAVEMITRSIRTYGP